jgi:hypothetical protein
MNVFRVVKRRTQQFIPIGTVIGAYQRVMLENFLQEKAVEATKQEKERKEEKT